MAAIRKRTTKAGAVSFQVRWLEPVRDEFRAPTGKMRQTSETFASERKAKAYLRKIETALESASHIDPSSQKAKANTPLGHYARQYLDSLAGTVDPTTIQGYEKLYRTHIAPVFGSRPVASITAADVDRFRASLLKPYERSFVTWGKPRADKGGERTKPRTVHRSPQTVKHIVGTLKRICDTALRDQAIAANPVLPARRGSTKRHNPSRQQPFSHRPLSASQVAALADYISRERRNPVYALVVVFAAYTGLRAAELQGLQVQDVALSDIPGTAGAVRVSRTVTRRQGEWQQGTPKTAKSVRTVPLAPWLADDMRDYLSRVHPFSATSRAVTAGRTHHISHAPLFPGRRNDRGGTTVGDVSHFDWAKPIAVDNLYHNYFQPASKALGLGSVRFHDLRHTFATLALSAGEHYMQVSKWLGHSSYVLTLSTYADYIAEDETKAPNFARPVVAASADNVVPLDRGRASG